MEWITELSAGVYKSGVSSTKMYDYQALVLIFIDHCAAFALH
jgi:hypothetical protein